MNANAKISWNEPHLFVIKLRTRQGWLRRLGLALVVAVVMWAAITFTGQGKFGPLQAVLTSLGAGLVLVALLDTGNIQREITIDKDGVEVDSAVGSLGHESFSLPQILVARLMTGEDWGKSCGALFLQTSDDLFVIGVPRKVDLANVANVLHRLGVDVELDGWDPPSGDTRVQVVDEVALPQSAEAGEARIRPVEPGEPPLNSPLTTAVTVVLALGPLLLALLGLIGAVVYLILKWSALAVMAKVLIGGGALAAVVAAFLYLILAGQFLAARYGIKAARQALASRPNALLNAGDDLIAVEVYDRPAWTALVTKSSDFGFLRADGAQRRLVLEGDKNRWEIPAGALTACRIEEAQVGKEGSPTGEVRYYVMLALQHDGELWEAGLIETRTALGNDGPDQRRQRAEGLLARIATAVAS